MDIDNHNNKKRKFSDDSIHERPCPELQQNNDPMDVEQSQEALRLEACECARRTHQELFENSSIPDRSRDYPKFARNEIRLGNMLGKGGFGTVYEVLGFDIDHQPQMKRTSSIRRLFGAKKTEPDAELLRGEMQSRKFIAKHCIRNGGDARYAVKQLSSNIVSNHIRLFQGIADLATETRIMSSLAHPNIMKLRAIAQGPSWFHPDYFIVMDRLYDTLQRRSLIVWKKRQNRSKGIVGKVTDYYGLKKAELYVDRIFAAFDLVCPKAVKMLTLQKIGSFLTICIFFYRVLPFIICINDGSCIVMSNLKM